MSGPAGMRPRKYVLDGAGNPVPEPDPEKWCLVFDDPRRLVARSEIGAVAVSTVFLGLDHRFAGDGPPLLYETMIFGGAHDQDQRRYSTREEALAGHAEMVERLKAEVAH